MNSDDCIEYTQADGFRPAQIGKFRELPNEGYPDWLTRLGFVRDVPLWEMGADPNVQDGALQIRAFVGTTTAPYKYMVEIDDGVYQPLIFVRRSDDLLALRIQLSSLLLTDVREQLKLIADGVRSQNKRAHLGGIL